MGLKGSRGERGRAEGRRRGVWTIPKAGQGNGVTSGARGLQGSCRAKELAAEEGGWGSGQRGNGLCGGGAQARADQIPSWASPGPLIRILIPPQ